MTISTLHLRYELFPKSSTRENSADHIQTVTFFWAISDFLSVKSKTISFTEDMVRQSNDDALLQLAADSSHQCSGAALWMLLLLRLTSVATDQRLELRNSKPLSSLALFSSC